MDTNNQHRMSGTSGTSGSMAHLHKVWNGSGEAGR